MRIARRKSYSRDPHRDNNAFSDNRETRQMEQECVMRVGRKKLKMTGHFPPSPGDPYLRLAFPREVDRER